MSNNHLVSIVSCISLGKQHVVNRSLLLLIDSRSDLSHRHLVSTFDSSGTSP